MNIKITYPLVNIQKAIENGPIEIVDFPMKNGGSFHCKMLNYQRVTFSRTSWTQMVPWFDPYHWPWRLVHLGNFHHITSEEAQEPHDVTMERHRLEKHLFFLGKKILFQSRKHGTKTWNKTWKKTWKHIHGSSSNWHFSEKTQGKTTPSNAPRCSGTSSNCFGSA